MKAKLLVKFFIFSFYFNDYLYSSILECFKGFFLNLKAKIVSQNRASSVDEGLISYRSNLNIFFYSSPFLEKPNLAFINSQSQTFSSGQLQKRRMVATKLALTLKLLDSLLENPEAILLHTSSIASLVFFIVALINRHSCCMITSESTNSTLGLDFNFILFVKNFLNCRCEAGELSSESPINFICRIYFRGRENHFFTEELLFQAVVPKIYLKILKNSVFLLQSLGFNKEVVVAKLQDLLFEPGENTFSFCADKIKNQISCFQAYVDTIIFGGFSDLLRLFTHDSLTKEKIVELRDKHVSPNFREVVQIPETPKKWKENVCRDFMNFNYKVLII